MAGRLPLVLLLLAVLVAGARFFRGPRSASDLTIVPDSVEYAVGAQRLATLGRCDLEIDGKAYPLRYAPWFPAAITPAYLVAPREIGAGIVPVLLFAVGGVLAAGAIGRRLAGSFGAAAASALLTCEVVYGDLAREIMSDVPAAALALAACARFLAMRSGSPTWRSWAAAGALVAAAAALRNEAAALVLPFLVLAARKPDRARSIAILLAPLAALAAATLAYQQAAFGDWRRNGYLFWCPVPLDDPRLAISTDYLRLNLHVLAQPWILAPAIAGVVGGAALLARRSSAARGAIGFALLGALPGSLLHLVFFFPERRFHLPLVALACAIGGAGIASLVPERARERFRWAAAAVALVPLLLPRPKDEPPNRRIVADALAEATPEDAVIVSAIDPVYLEPLVLRGTRRRAVPVSRRVEYASKAVAWKRVHPIDPPALGPLDHRAPGLFRAGAVDVVPWTADERPERLAELVRQGVPVFVDRSFLPRQFPIDRARELGLELEALPGRPWLSRLVLASAGD